MEINSTGGRGWKFVPWLAKTWQQSRSRNPCPEIGGWSCCVVTSEPPRACKLWRRHASLSELSNFPTANGDGWYRRKFSGLDIRRGWSGIMRWFSTFSKFGSKRYLYLKHLIVLAYKFKSLSFFFCFKISSSFCLYCSEASQGVCQLLQY